MSRRAIVLLLGLALASLGATLLILAEMSEPSEAEKERGLHAARLAQVRKRQ